MQGTSAPGTIGRMVTRQVTALGSTCVASFLRVLRTCAGRAIPWWIVGNSGVLIRWSGHNYFITILYFYERLNKYEYEYCFRLALVDL